MSGFRLAPILMTLSNCSASCNNNTLIAYSFCAGIADWIRKITHNLEVLTIVLLWHSFLIIILTTYYHWQKGCPSSVDVRDVQEGMFVTWCILQDEWLKRLIKTRGCAPENFSLRVVQLQSIGRHPSRNLIGTDGHCLAEGVSPGSSLPDLNRFRYPPSVRRNRLNNCAFSTS